MARAPAQKKAAAQAKLQERHQMTLTIDMTENNFQRLAALLLFADKIEPPNPLDVGQLPWEEPFLCPCEGKNLDCHTCYPLDLDYEDIRRGVVKRLEPYVKIHGREKVIALLKSFGGETLPQVPQHQLMGLFDALA